MLDRLASPRERAGELPARRDLPRIKQTRRQPLLVDARLELLGILEMPPAGLERQLRRRIPRYPHRCRIERPGFDIPAMLVGFAAVETADLQLDAVEHDPAGDDAEADMRRIEPMVADRRFGRIHDRLAMHEGGRAERGLTRQAAVKDRKST